MLARGIARAGYSARWHRQWMRLAALKWRERHCAAHLTTALWWRDYWLTYEEPLDTAQ